MSAGSFLYALHVAFQRACEPVRYLRERTARARLRAAAVEHEAAYYARVAINDVEPRVTQHIGHAQARLQKANQERLAAELALSKLEGFGGLRRAA